MSGFWEAQKEHHVFLRGTISRVCFKDKNPFGTRKIHTSPNRWEQCPFCFPLNPPCGCRSKNRYQNETLVSGNMNQNLQNPSWLILSHTHMGLSLSVPVSVGFKRKPTGKPATDLRHFGGAPKTRHTHIWRIPKTTLPFSPRPNAKQNQPPKRERPTWSLHDPK